MEDMITLEFTIPSIYLMMVVRERAFVNFNNWTLYKLCNIENELLPTLIRIRHTKILQATRMSYSKEGSDEQFKHTPKVINSWRIELLTTSVVSKTFCQPLRIDDTNVASRYIKVRSQNCLKWRSEMQD